MGKLVLIDSQIFIWGIKGYASEGQEANVENAKMFITWLSENDYNLLLPVPQMAELLSYAPPEQQGTIRALFDKRFMIVPFDEMAAVKCGELIYLSLNDEDLIKYRLEQRVYKNKIKFDCMLVAIAITRGVSKIYSHDPDMTKFANGQIEVVKMPKFTANTNLFGEQLQPHITHE